MGLIDPNADFDPAEGDDDATVVYMPGVQQGPADTASPEVTQEPELPLSRQWPWFLVLIGVVVSLAVVASDHFRRGAVMLAASFAVALVMRLVLPERRAGWLAVRSRKVDVLSLILLTGGLVVLTFWVPSPS